MKSPGMPRNIPHPGLLRHGVR